jgi:TetR/AcrR family transcriptional regulator, ethionamide resistance regulator
VTSQHSRRTQRQLAAGPRKGEIREQQILDATESLLVTTAFTQLTMDDISAEAGLSRSALYFYFASKEAVLGALHERTHQEMARTTDPLTEADGPLAEAMHEAIEQVCRNWRAHRHALRTFHETAMVSPEFGDEWRARLERHVVVLAGLIEREIDAGRAAPAPPSARAIASSWFWMLENQFYELFRRDHTRREERELVDTLNTLWFRVIGSGAGSRGVTGVTPR